MNTECPKRSMRRLCCYIFYIHSSWAFCMLLILYVYYYLFTRFLMSISLSALTVMGHNPPDCYDGMTKDGLMCKTYCKNLPLVPAFGTEWWSPRSNTIMHSTCMCTYLLYYYVDKDLNFHVECSYLFLSLRNRKYTSVTHGRLIQVPG